MRKLITAVILIPMLAACTIAEVVNEQVAGGGTPVYDYADDVERYVVGTGDWIKRTQVRDGLKILERKVQEHDWLLMSYLEVSVYIKNIDTNATYYRHGDFINVDDKVRHAETFASSVIHELVHHADYEGYIDFEGIQAIPSVHYASEVYASSHIVDNILSKSHSTMYKEATTELISAAIMGYHSVDSYQFGAIDEAHDNKDYQSVCKMLEINLAAIRDIASHFDIDPESLDDITEDYYYRNADCTF